MGDEYSGDWGFYDDYSYSPSEYDFGSMNFDLGDFASGDGFFDDGYVYEDSGLGAIAFDDSINFDADFDSSYTYDGAEGPTVDWGFDGTNADSIGDADFDNNYQYTDAEGPAVDMGFGGDSWYVGDADFDSDYKYDPNTPEGPAVDLGFGKNGAGATGGRSGGGGGNSGGGNSGGGNSGGGNSGAGGKTAEEVEEEARRQVLQDADEGRTTTTGLPPGVPPPPPPAPTQPPRPPAPTPPPGRPTIPGTPSKPKDDDKKKPSGLGSLLPLLMLLGVLGDKGKNAGGGSLIPSLKADRKQTPYSAPTRPGAGGRRYFEPTRYMAEGGLAGLSRGRLVRGPGDGVSDSIPAQINGDQPAAIADGEYVFDARSVAALGNGSTEAGARVLDELRARIEAAEKRAGTGQDNGARKLLQKMKV